MNAHDTAPLPLLPPRPADGHKGTFGTVAVVGGCHRGDTVMLGAPILAGGAALRSGVGLCRLIVPRPLLIPALTALPSATGEAFDGPAPRHPYTQADAMVIGPGLGPDDQHAIARYIAKASRPAVIDADGLNAVATADALENTLDGCMITPHPGEASRLAHALGIGLDLSTPLGRATAAIDLAERTNAIVVLKGRGTVVAQGLTHWVCDRGAPCLGTAGTGDVLAGLLGGLLAQSRAGAWTLTDFDLACIGVWAHAVAGERWAASRGSNAGLLAQELADLLPGCLIRHGTPEAEA